MPDCLAEPDPAGMERSREPVKKFWNWKKTKTVNQETGQEAEERILSALSFTKEPAPRARLLYALVTPDGVTELDQ